VILFVWFYIFKKKAWQENVRILGLNYSTQYNGGIQWAMIKQLKTIIDQRDSKRSLIKTTFRAVQPKYL